MRISPKKAKEMEKEIMQIFNSGCINAMDIAVKIGCSHSYVNKVIKNNGHTRKTRFELLYDRIRDDYQNGMPIGDIAYKYNYTSQYISKIIRNKKTIDTETIEKIRNMIMQGADYEQILQKIDNASIGIIRMVKNRLYKKIKEKKINQNPYYTPRWAIKGTIVEVYDK